MTSLARSILFRLGLAALILFAVFTATARLALPYLGERYQSDIQQALSQAFESEVGLERLEARWHGFGPELRLFGVRLGHLTLEEVRIELATLESLLAMRPVVQSVYLVRAKLRLLRDQESRLQLLDLQRADQAATGQDSQALLLKRLPLGLGFIDSEILLQSVKNPLPLHLVHSNLTLSRQKDGFSLWGRLHLAGSEQSEIQAIARIKGPIDEPGQWSGQLSLKTQALDLEEVLLPVLDPEQFQVNGKLELDLWASIDKGQVERLEGGLDLSGFGIQRFSEKAQAFVGSGFDRLGGQMRWALQEQGWRLQLVGLDLERNQNHWPDAAISIQGQTSDGRLRQLEASANFVRLEDILSLAEVLPSRIENNLLRLVQRLNPAGDVRDLDLEARLEGDAIHWAMEGQAQEIRTQAFGGFPAIEGLDGHFIANDSGGRLSLNENDIRLSFANGLFAAPLQFMGLKTELFWQRFERDGGRGWQVGSQLVGLSTPDFACQSRFSLSLPDEGLAHLALVTRLGEAKATAIGRYLPVGVLNPKVAQWLKEAPLGGRITGGSLDFIGPLADFPFDQRPTGRFHAQVELEDGALNYHQGLPPVKEASAQLLFQNNSFSANIQQARIAKGQVHGAQIAIERLHPATPLKIKGEISGALFENIQDLSKTSLAQYLGEAADQLRGAGNGRLSLQLALPLEQGHPEAQINGQLELQGNLVELPKWQLTLEDAQGILEFDHNGLSANGIKARALDSPIRLDIRTKGAGSTEFISTARLPVQALIKRRLGLELPLLEGNADWQLKVDIPHKSQGAKTYPLLTLSSDLKGIKIPLPAPFGKSATEARALSVRVQPSATDEPTQVMLELGKEIKARLELKQQDKGMEVERAEIRLGGAEAERPSLPGLSIRGQLTELQLDPLLEALDRQGSARPKQWPHLDLTLGQLSYRALRLKNLHIKGGPRGSDWAGSLDGAEIKGQIYVPGNLKQKALELDLDRLVLAGPADGPSQTPPSTQDPRGLPGLNLKANHLIMNKEDLGRLDIQARPSAQGIDIKQLRVNSEWFSLEGQASWQAGKPGPLTDTNLKLQVTDLGRLQKALGDAPDIARSGANLSGTLSWPGSPVDFGRLELSGNLKLKVSKGSLLDVEPGAGRIFGLLNLGSIHRRLSLDFTDFLGKGFAFDKIEGDVELRQGNALTNNLVMAAPGGDLKFYGRTGLRKRDIDQVVELYPEISGTLASAGGFVAGPVVGVGLFIANKVIGKQLNKIVKVRYRVQGDWKTPKVTRIADGAKADIQEPLNQPSRPTPPSSKPPGFLDQ